MLARGAVLTAFLADLGPDIVGAARLVGVAGGVTDPLVGAASDAARSRIGPVATGFVSVLLLTAATRLVRHWTGRAARPGP